MASHRKAFLRLLTVLIFCLPLVNLALAQSGNETLPPPPHSDSVHRKHVLVIGETKGWEHESVSAAMDAIYTMGKSSGLWDTEMRTDTKLLTKKDLPLNAKEPELLRRRGVHQYHRRATPGRQPETGLPVVYPR